MVISEFVTDYYHAVVSPDTRLCLFFSMVEVRLELIFYYLILYKINDFHMTLHMLRTVSTLMYCVIQPAYGLPFSQKQLPDFLQFYLSFESCFVSIASSTGYPCDTVHTNIPILLQQCSVMLKLYIWNSSHSAILAY